MKLSKGLDFICRKWFSYKACQQWHRDVSSPFSLSLHLLGEFSATATSGISSATTSSEKNPATGQNTANLCHVPAGLHQNRQRMLLFIIVESQLVGFPLRMQRQEWQARRAYKGFRPTVEEISEWARTNERRHMDRRHVQLATHEVAVGIQRKGHQASIIQQNEAWVTSYFCAISREMCFSHERNLACRGSEDLKYNCAVLNPDLKYR